MEKKNKIKLLVDRAGFTIGLVGSIFSIVSFFGDIPPKFGIAISVLCAIAFVILVVKASAYLFDRQKLQAELKNQYIDLLVALSSYGHKIFHNLRNNTATINTKAQINIKSESVTICDRFEQFFRKLLNVDISVCIKLFKMDTILDGDRNKWRLYTLARSSSTDQDRFKKDNDDITILGNTDFDIILSEAEGQEDWFACWNLKELNGYRNTRKDYDKYYNSTIVVPIRIVSDLVASKIRVKNVPGSYHVLGFLCVDSLATFNDQKDLFMIALEFAKSFGDSLYTYFESYLVKGVESVSEGQAQKAKAVN